MAKTDAATEARLSDALKTLREGSERMAAWDLHKLDVIYGKAYFHEAVDQISLRIQVERIRLGNKQHAPWARVKSHERMWLISQLIDVTQPTVWSYWNSKSAVSIGPFRLRWLADMEYMACHPELDLSKRGESLWRWYLEVLGLGAQPPPAKDKGDGKRRQKSASKPRATIPVARHIRTR